MKGLHTLFCLNLSEGFMACTRLMIPTTDRWFIAPWAVALACSLERARYENIPCFTFIDNSISIVVGVILGVGIGNWTWITTVDISTFCKNIYFTHQQAMVIVNSIQSIFFISLRWSKKTVLTCAYWLWSTPLWFPILLVTCSDKVTWSKNMPRVTCICDAILNLESRAMESGINHI